MKPIYLDPNQVPQYLRGSYTGRKFKAIVTESITVPKDAGVWGGGSRETYSFVELATGRSVPSPCQQTAPWDSARQEFNSPLPAGIAMVKASMFCGKDMGLTFYVHPDSAAKLLPEATAELTETQKLVLNATASLKASYNGKDRYENMREEMDARFGRHYTQEEIDKMLTKNYSLIEQHGDVRRKDGKLISERIAELVNWPRRFPSRAAWDAAKAELITLGYLNKAGAITVKGRNAR